MKGHGKSLAKLYVLVLLGLASCSTIDDSKDLSNIFNSAVYVTDIQETKDRRIFHISAFLCNRSRQSILISTHAFLGISWRSDDNQAGTGITPLFNCNVSKGLNRYYNRLGVPIYSLSPGEFASDATIRYDFIFEEESGPMELFSIENLKSGIFHLELITEVVDGHCNPREVAIEMEVPGKKFIETRRKSMDIVCPSVNITRGVHKSQQ